ncbi:hypothetical protein ACRCQA_31510, partial [Pseudomonas aeruginosa]
MTTTTPSGPDPRTSAPPPRRARRPPPPPPDPAEVARSIRQQLDTPYLSVEVDGDLLLIPRD